MRHAPLSPRRRVRTSTRPQVELMEARVLLATITVNTAADLEAADGTLSLREAIQVANGTLAVSALSPQEHLQVSGALTNPNTTTSAIVTIGNMLVVNVPSPPGPTQLWSYTGQGSNWVRNV